MKAKPKAFVAALVVDIGGDLYTVTRMAELIFKFCKAADPMHLGYNVLPTLNMCSCPDRKWRSRPCKHIRAVPECNLMQLLPVPVVAVPAVNGTTPPVERGAT